ncbi:MAG: hypothetical protein JWM53_5479, partial [bacterium]|nr:hypothetical protein [bacterium]
MSSVFAFMHLHIFYHDNTESSLRVRPQQRTWRTLLLSVIAVVGIVACSKGGRSATSVSTSIVPASTSTPPSSVKATQTLCAFLSRIDHDASAAKSEAQGLRILKSFSPQFERHLKSAPVWAASDLPIVIQASRQAIETNDLTVLSTD